MIKKILAAAAVAFFASTANANLIENGNFETGTFAGSWTSEGFVAVAGQYPHASAFYFGGGSTALNGRYLVAFNGGDQAPNGKIAQTFNTVQGTEYAVMFDFGATTGANHWITANIFGADGASLLRSIDANGNNNQVDLQSLVFSFVADGNRSTLQFVDNIGNDSISKDGLLDNVSVTAVPEPASMALLGLGLLGVAAARRTSGKSKKN